MVLVMVLLLAKQIITLYHAVQKLFAKDQHALVMAALATLSACDAPNVDVAAQDEKAAKTAASTVSESPVDEQSEMFAYLDESDLIDAYYEVK